MTTPLDGDFSLLDRLTLFNIVRIPLVINRQPLPLMDNTTLTRGQSPVEGGDLLLQDASNQVDLDVNRLGRAVIGYSILSKG